MIRRLVIVGAGRLGLSLAADLRGWPALGSIAVVGRRAARPAFLAAFPDIEYASRPGAPRQGPPLLLLFCVQDDRLEGAARAWAEALREAGGGVALHTSGARPSSALAPLGAGCGMALGSWHPLAAVAEPAAGALRGVTVGVEGEEAAVALGLEVARRVGGRPVRVPPGGKARYHAAAVFASNYLLACLHAAMEELRAASEGSVPDDALLPLARSALANFERLGLPAGATGPLSRGDVETVAGHLAALDPPRGALYRALGRELLGAVRAALPAHAAERLEALFRAP